jgi:hypothetical protein
MPSLELCRITVSYWSWLASVIMCCAKRNKTRKIHRVGLRRIDRELDVATFLKTQFTMRAMLLTLTNHSQRLQFKKYYRHVIQDDPGDSSTSDSQSSDDSEPTTPKPINPISHRLNRALDKTVSPKIPPS